MMFYLLCFLFLCQATSNILKDEFQRRVAAQSSDEPDRYTHGVHLRTGLGRVTHFHYDAKVHPKIIAPHHTEGTAVTACTQSTVTIRVDPTLIDAHIWDVGHKFTTHNEHFSCPNPHDGTASESPSYREVTAVTSTDEAATGMKLYTLTTKPAAFADFFDTLTMKMHSTHMLHKDQSQIDKHAADSTGRRLDETLASDIVEEKNKRNNNNKNKKKSMRSSILNNPELRKLLTSRSVEDEFDQQQQPRRRLWSRRRRGKHHHGLLHKVGKWVKKKIIQPAEKAIKLVVTGKAEKDWDKDFSMNWNYDKVLGGPIKTYPIHGQTACTSCFFHADAGYKVEIDVEHYHLEHIIAEVYGDVKLEMAMTNPGPAVDVKKLNNVFSSQLFSVTFTLGPVPITVSLNLDIDLGLHFTVKEVGATPHIQAQGNGHIRFGKEYHRSSGWAPVNSHSLDLSFDSAGGTVHADLLLYANIVSCCFF